jgi:hypothetical protein
MYYTGIKLSLLYRCKILSLYNGEGARGRGCGGCYKEQQLGEHLDSKTRK